MINDLFGLMNERKIAIGEVKVMPEALVALIALIDEGKINSGTAKEVLAQMIENGQAPGAIVEVKGLAQISDEQQLASIITAVIKDNP